MSVQVLLDRAKAKGLNVSLEGSKLKVRASQEPEGEAKALVVELRRRKQEVLEALTQETTPEALAASILAENTQAEAAQILAFWKRAFGVDLERVRERSAEVGVQEHLRRLREWQRRFGG